MVLAGEQVTDTVDRKPVPFPEKIMVMGDRGKSRFRDKVCDRQSQRNVHGDAQRVLNDQNLNVELACEIIKRAFEVIADGVNQAGRIRITPVFSENFPVDKVNVGVPEIGVWQQHADIRIRVQHSPQPITDMAMIPKDPGPFFGPGPLGLHLDPAGDIWGWGAL